MPSVMAVMNLATLHSTAPTRFLLQEHHATYTDLIQGIHIPTPEGTDHTPPIVIPYMVDISAGHSLAAIPTTTEVAVSESTPCTPHPATTAACNNLWLMDAPITTHAVTPTGIVTLHPAPAIFPTDVIYTSPQTRSSLSPASPTTLHRNLSQEKPSNIQDLQPPINPIIPRLSPSRIPLQILYQIQTATLIL